MFFLHNSTFDNLNESGLKLFDAAVLSTAGGKAGQAGS